MTVHAAHVALRDLGKHGRPPTSISDQVRDRIGLVGPVSMIELEHDDVIRAAVNTGMRAKVLLEQSPPHITLHSVALLRAAHVDRAILDVMRVGVVNGAGPAVAQAPSSLPHLEAELLDRSVEPAPRAATHHVHAGRSTFTRPMPRTPRLPRSPRGHPHGASRIAALCGAGDSSRTAHRTSRSRAG